MAENDVGAPAPGVLLVNLGTPDEPTPGAVRRYLREFLSDPRVVELPRWLWLPILYPIFPRRSTDEEPHELAWRKLFVQAAIMGVAVYMISVLLGIISAYLLARPRTWWTALLDPLFLLPLGTSAVTLGFGYLLAMGAWRTSPLLIPMAHTLIAFPFVVRTLLPALRSLDPRLREAAAVLGASPMRTWIEVDAPLLFRAALVGATFAFTISLGEFGATLLVARPDLPTMPIVIYQALGRPGLLNYGQALAMSTILMAVTGLALFIIERFRFQELGEF